MPSVMDRVVSRLGIAVLTVSDTRTPATDTSGTLIAEELARAGHEIVVRQIVRDEIAAIQSVLKTSLDDAGVDVIVSTGGTGITARDVTPEALAPFVTKWIPGFGELFRMLSYSEIGPSTIQSRAEAALCGATLVFALPGSNSAVRLALEKIIVPQLDLRTRPCNFAELLPRIRG
jgi:molybdopterin adenylyltransferase